MSNTVRTVLVIIVTVVWAINFTAPIFSPTFKPSPELNVAFMAILGVLTASYRRDEDDQKKKPKPRHVPEEEES